jgi:hypothetical protein
MNYSDLISGVHYYTYDKTVYPFYQKVSQIFNTTTPLELFHTKADSIEQVTFDNDTSTDYHKMYYKSPLYKEMIDIYDNFIVNNILPIFKEDIVVQKEPSFRICLPDNTALGKCTTDTDKNIIGLHCDGDYNHPPEEINFMLSITGQEGTNSCYIESQPNKGDFFPVKMNQGEYVSFYGNKCRHYNMLNDTGKTRISIDFRVIPLSKYKETDSVAVHSNRKFAIGDYYRIQRLP